jgi:hypothetical protein
LLSDITNLGKIFRNRPSAKHGSKVEPIAILLEFCRKKGRGNGKYKTL